MAKHQKNDEFYTQLSDIESELRHYADHFRDAVVYCNCDDPSVSKFFHYFSHNFAHLGLRRLITACYKNRQRDIFSQHDADSAIWLDYAGSPRGDRVPDLSDIGVRPLEGDGDFRSQECIDLLAQADIVVTNPPFSLFREYVNQLITYDKKFIVVGPWNAVTYKDVFPHIKAGRLWLGYGFAAGNAFFAVPSRARTNYAAGVYDAATGLVKFRNVAWFTNLDHEKRHEPLVLHKHYSPEEYPTYDNYNAINVNKTADIPKDWEGVMGVPITFLDKYNPNQFEIVGVSYLWDTGFKSHKLYDDFVEVTQEGAPTGLSGQKANGYPMLSGRPKRGHYLRHGSDVVYSLYKRIFVRRRKRVD